MYEWWAKDGNAEGCRCHFVCIILDDNGNPLAPAAIKRARQTFEKMKANGKGEWTKVL
ncbi:hypothetical protein D9M70_578680 [compost metagenome]